MNILTICLAELKMMSRNRVSFVVLMLMPILMILLMGNAMKPAFQKVKSIEKFEVLYVNQDDGSLGKAFDTMLKDELSKYIIPVATSPEKIQSKLQSGGYAAAIVIPKDLSSKVSKSQKGEIAVISSGKDTIKDFVTRTIVSSFMESINTQTGILKGYTSFMPEADTKEAAQKLTETASAKGYDFIAQKAVEQSKTSNLTSYQYFTASMLLFFMLSVGTGIGSILLKERQDKIYDRINTFRVKRSEYLLGQVSAHAFSSILQVLIVILFTKYVLKVDWGTNVAGIVMTLLIVIFLSSSIGIFFSSLLRSQKSLSAAMSIVLWLITFAGGGFTPVPALEPIGKFTFYQWGLNALSTFMGRGHLRDAAGWLSLLMATALIFWTASIILYRRRISHE